MTIEEISLFLDLHRSLCLDLAMAREFPGYVRGVFLRDGNRVVIEFEQFGFDEGGAYFYGEYQDLTSAIGALETYLGRPIAEWRPLAPAANYPATSEEFDISEGNRRLSSAISQGTVPLPEGATFELRGSSYWLQHDLAQRRGDVAGENEA